MYISKEKREAFEMKINTINSKIKPRELVIQSKWDDKTQSNLYKALIGNKAVGAGWMSRDEIETLTDELLTGN